MALILVLHDSEAERHIIHCDSEVAILLTTGDYRPSANYDLVRRARALYHELKVSNKITLIKHLKAHKGTRGTSLQMLRPKPKPKRNTAPERTATPPTS